MKRQDRPDSVGTTCRYRVRPVVFFGLQIIIPLVLGLWIYLLFRPDTYLAASLRQIINFPMEVVFATPQPILRFLRNYAADVLWAYSLGFAVTGILYGGTAARWPAPLICVAFEIVMETLQLTSVISGTFDFVDIVLEAGATLLAFAMIKRYEGRNNNGENRQSD